MNVIELPRTITSLLYVSRSRLQPEQMPQVDGIVELARQRNARLGVTGALIFTEIHFAQVLEGLKPAVDELMRSIAADKRHGDLTVVETITVPEPRFPDWAMAYRGPSFYVDRHVKPLLAAPADMSQRTRSIAELLSILQELSRQS
jgi:hypothetical protein